MAAHWFSNTIRSIQKWSGFLGYIKQLPQRILSLSRIPSTAYVHIYFDRWLYITEINTNYAVFDQLYQKGQLPEVLYRIIHPDKHASLPQLFYSSLYKYPAQKIKIYLYVNGEAYTTKGKFRVVSTQKEYVLHLTRIKKLETEVPFIHAVPYTQLSVYHKKVAYALYNYILQDKLNDPLTMQELLEHYPASRGNLYKIFKNVIGVSPNIVRRDHRLWGFKHRLLATDLPVHHLCSETGFKSRSHLYKLFYNSFGLPPYKFRQKYG